MTDGFEEFVDDHLPRVLRLTGALTGDRYLAEDLDDPSTWTDLAAALP